MTVKESVLNIGRPVPLTGILAEGSGTLGLILVNSGIMHRVGACRLSVRVARAVTGSLDLPSFRFDFSGLGDSENRRGGVDFDEAAVNEVIEVMDHLQRQQGVDRFILYGLCSGAVISCRAATRDKRVVGVAQVDGYCYPTNRAYLGYYAERLLAPAVWRERLARWRSPMESRAVLSAGKNDFEVPDFASDPGREHIAGELRQLVQRGVQLHCVFAGRDPNFYYPAQYRHCFRDVDFGDQLSLEHYPRASHIFTEPGYQKEMIDGLVRWVDHTRRSWNLYGRESAKPSKDSARSGAYRLQETTV